MLVKPSGPPPEEVVQKAPSTSRRVSRHAQAEDDLLAFLLISTWMLITGRTLRSDVPPGQLSESELIEFWAEDGAAGDGGPVAGTHGLGPPR
jgi:hypothetical protein